MFAYGAKGFHQSDLSRDTAILSFGTCYVLGWERERKHLYLCVCVCVSNNWSKRMNIFRALDFSDQIFFHKQDSPVKNIGYILPHFPVFFLCTSPHEVLREIDVVLYFQSNISPVQCMSIFSCHEIYFKVGL